MAGALSTKERVYLTALIDKVRPITYARAGLLLITVKDRIRVQEVNYGLNGSLLVSYGPKDTLWQASLTAIKH